ncbi:sulfate adenylyltransferase subunit 1 [Jatrophihabitans sp. GAS493]|uniref:sulfate adenylyltransferase subunit 1 n=1 Tax=Jatrophihabitans sp. GAS493 TaxID=1907575 RepID=UPI000BB6D45F|nr:GTP-binding protein [Jatrophihabitans sp. GAS493]SOD74344.1 sulfate adenylyltransferase subunit 1 [Jatrophihabitans sp. GAS493]
MPGQLLRVVTAGSVDDGKSTLVGRLLHDAKAVLSDQLTAVEAASERRGYDGADLALLVDGLRAEREQGITIDVAYRYFATARRTFILADTPGHVQYTRNTVTGASTADVAVILVDARSGVVEQTKRHAAVAQLLRVEHVVLAVNKMDLVDYAEDVFDQIVTDFAAAAASLKLASFTPIPIAALAGDNVVDASTHMHWYTGPALLQFLEDVESRPALDVPARFPVQVVVRPRSAEYPDYRGYAGRVEAGTLRVGDKIVVLPSGRSSAVEGIDTPDGELTEAPAGRSVVLRLTDDIDIARGDLLAVDRDPRPVVTREVTATLCWLTDRPLRAGDRFSLRHTTRDVRAVVDGVVSKLDVATVTSEPATELGLNDIGNVRIRLADPIIVDAYATNRSTGAFLLVDDASGATVAAGMVAEFPN